MRLNFQQEKVGEKISLLKEVKMYKISKISLSNLSILLCKNLLKVKKFYDSSILLIILYCLLTASLTR
jgi:hypothetical protein